MSAGRPPTQFEATRARLRKAIEGGLFEASDLLPGERDLAAQLGVSRTTLRRVLGVLVGEGLLMHRQGIGTFVTRGEAGPTPPAPPADRPASLAGFTDMMLRRGRVPTARALQHDLVEPTAEQAMMLGCSARERVIRLRRLRCADGTPIQVEENVLPAALAPIDLSALGGSLYAALAAHGIAPVRALQRWQVGVAEAADAEALGVPPACPIIVMRRTDYLEGGRCCLFTTVTLRADCFDLLVDLDGAASLTKP